MARMTAQQRGGDALLIGLHLTLILCAGALGAVVAMSLWRLAAAG